MNGQRMKCNTYENRKIVDEYVEMFNPYENKPSIKIDLVALTRYAKEHNKKASELSEQEMELFKNK